MFFRKKAGEPTVIYPHNGRVWRIREVYEGGYFGIEGRDCIGPWPDTASLCKAIDELDGEPPMSIFKWAKPTITDNGKSLELKVTIDDEAAPVTPVPPPQAMGYRALDGSLHATPKGAKTKNVDVLLSGFRGDIQRAITYATGYICDLEATAKSKGVRFLIARLRRLADDLEQHAA